MIILCGSSISMMEKYALDYDSPLYGRRTGQWMVDRLDIIHLKEFFLSYSFEDILTVYSAIDAIPGYLMQFDSLLLYGKILKEISCQKANSCTRKWGYYFEKSCEISVKYVMHHRPGQPRHTSPLQIYILLPYKM